MRALDDIRRSIVAANASDEFRIITPIALGNKDVRGTAEIGRPERSELATLPAVATTDLLN